MSGACTGADPVVCAALDQCHVAGTCDAATGVCSNPAASDGTTCNDGDACTLGDACTMGACAGTPVVCMPLDGCHLAGTCSMSTGMCDNPLAADGTVCVDPNACTLGSTCTAGACGGGTACTTLPCAASLTAFSGTNTPGWTFNGVAAYDATANTVVLVDAGQLLSAGSVFYDDAIPTDSFSVSFDFRMTTTGGSAGRADGIAFVLTTSGATGLGNNGGGLGMVGLSGWGAELDIYNDQDCSDADDDHAGIDTLTACGSGEPTPLATSPYLDDGTPTHGVGDMGDGQWRTATVTVANSQMSLHITDPVSSAVLPIPNLQSVALPAFQTGTQYTYGFSAGGGNLAARQEIRNVTVTFPSKRCL